MNTLWCVANTTFTVFYLLLQLSYAYYIVPIYDRALLVNCLLLLPAHHLHQSVPVLWCAHPHLHHHAHPEGRNRLAIAGHVGFRRLYRM